MLNPEMKYPMIEDSIKLIKQIKILDSDAPHINKRKRTQVYVNRNISMSLKSTKATL